MDDQAKIVHDTFVKLRALSSEIALLLQAVEAEVQRRGWKCTGGTNVVTADNSGSLQQPAYWLPRFFFRFFRNESLPHVMAWVSVLTDSPGRPEKMSESLVSGGWISWRPGDVIANSYSYLLAETHIWRDERRDDGTVVVGPIPEWIKNRPKDGGQLGTLALPLDEIRDAASLKEKIADPLLAAIASHVARSSNHPADPCAASNDAATDENVDRIESRMSSGEAVGPAKDQES